MISTILKIDEVPKQTRISVRTLHYYDEIGLLSPSHRTETGHRLYIDRDIIRLQQIMSLRQLGFSLEEIRECLENPVFSLQKVIDLHRTQLREQLVVSHTLLNRLNAIAKGLQTTQSVSVEHLIKAMETMTMSEEYFSPEQQEVLNARFREGEAKWQKLLTQIRTEMNKDTDLNNPIVQILARSWRSEMQTLIDGDLEIYKSLVRVYQREGIEAASLGTLDSATFEYILKAVSFLSLAEEAELDISFKRFTPEAMQVISLGLEAVRHLNLNYFGTEGILLGLLAEGTGIAAVVLMAAGVNFEVVRLHSEQWTRSLAVTPDDIPANLPFTPRTVRIFELAVESALQLHQGQVGTEHLLLGILKEGEEEGGLAIRILKENFGIDLKHLEQQLRLAMSQ